MQPAFGEEPVGGTTGYATARQRGSTRLRPIVPNLRARFGLTALETVQVMREAARILRQSA